MKLNLELLDGQYSIARLDADQPQPQVPSAGFWTLTQTAEEISLVCLSEFCEAGSFQKIESGWSCMRILGPIPFEMTGVLAALINPLRDEKIGIFAISTFDTDYLLVKTGDLNVAIETLEGAGHRFTKPDQS